MLNKGGKIFVFTLLIAISGFFYTQIALTDAPDVIISEICWMGDSESSSHEWIELKNNTDEDINLEGWILVALDSSPNIFLAGILPSGSYFLLERTSDESAPEVLADLIYSGALSNSGETLELRDEDDDLVDFVDSLENWAAGDNETKQTMERKEDLSWQTSKDPFGTPKKENSQVVEEGEEVEEVIIPSSGGGGTTAPKKPTKPEIVINEIYPNPIDSDREFEFIEINNLSNFSADLAGWRIEDDRGRVYEFGKFDSLFDIEINNHIPARGFLVLFRSISGLVLNNNGGEIKFFSPDAKKAKQTLKYEKASPGLAYINTKTINLEKITTSTRKFLLNSTSVGDWVWTKMPTPGNANQVESVNKAPEISFSFPEEIIVGQSVFFDSSDTIDEDGDSLSFFWDFGDGIKLEVAEAAHTFLKPGEYGVKLEVNDGQESSILEKSIRVLNPFEESRENEDLNSTIGQDYFARELSWINQAKENNLKDFDLSINFANDLEAVKVSLEEARELPLKTMIITQGVVVVEPGVFGTQYFYIASSPALKIYNYKKDFPPLAMGDFVKVDGELSELRGELCLKTKEIGDIEILDSGELLAPQKINSEDVVEENIDRLIELEGEVLEKKSPRVYLGDNFGEAVVYIKSGTKIDTKRIEKGEIIRVVGLLGKVSEELVIMPRGNDDIILLENEGSGNIAGVEEVQEEWELPKRDKKNELTKYIIALFLLAVCLLTVFFYKKRKK